MPDTHMLHDFADYMTRAYRKRMHEILEDDRLPLYLREHLSESSNYYTNNNLYTMVDTLVWLSHDDTQKKQLLDRELDEL